MARNGLIHEANEVLKDLERTRGRLAKQLANLRAYEGWILKKEGRKKRGRIYYDVVRPGAKRKSYLGSEQSEDVLNVKRLRYAREAIDILDSDIALLKDLTENYVTPDYQHVNARLPLTYQTNLPAIVPHAAGAGSFTVPVSRGTGSGKASTQLSPASGSGKLHKSSSSAAAASPSQAFTIARPSMPPEAVDWMHKLQEEKAKYPPFKPEQLKHPAMDGTMMRSKSEVIIANILFLAGIPYVYEAPLLINGRSILPDFTILSLIDLTTVMIIEHQGMVFVEEYADKFIRSLKTYLKTDWIPNENLFFTFDDARETLNPRQVISILRKFIKPSIEVQSISLAI